jgi:hypothetical protein
MFLGIVISKEDPGALMLKDGLQYFASSDGAIEHQITRDEFETSLFYNILFGSSKLVMPDVFFFNCTPLLSHLQMTPGRVPFFVQALRKSLIIPAFRSETVVTFSDSLRELGGESIRGVERDNFDVARIARLLDNSYPDDQPPALWQSDMGSRFEALVDHIFNEPSDHIADPDLRRLWDASRDWRLRGVEGAKKLTRSLGGTGLRRAEIWNSLGQWLGILGEGRSFNKPVELIDAVQAEYPQHAELAAFVVNITNISYQLNQASGLELLGSLSEPNVPRVLSRPAATVIPALSALETWQSPTRVFEHTVKVPKVSAMLNADSTRLIEVREGEQGLSYRHYRSEWVIDPSDHNTADLERAADHYAAAIRSAVKGAQENTRIVQVSNASRTMVGGALAAMIGSLGSLISTHEGYALITSLAGAGAGASAIVKNVTKPVSQRYKVEVSSYAKTAEYNLGPASGESTPTAG